MNIAYCFTFLWAIALGRRLIITGGVCSASPPYIWYIIAYNGCIRIPNYGSTEGNVEAWGHRRFFCLRAVANPLLAPLLASALESMHCPFGSDGLQEGWKDQFNEVM